MHPMGKFEKKFYGSNAINEKGQITIPIKAREALGIKAGDEIVFFGHGQLLHLVNAEQLDEMLDMMRKGFAEREAEVKMVRDSIKNKKKQ